MPEVPVLPTLLQLLFEQFLWSNSVFLFVPIHYLDVWEKSSGRLKCLVCMMMITSTRQPCLGYNLQKKVQWIFSYRNMQITRSLNWISCHNWTWYEPTKHRLYRVTLFVNVLFDLLLICSLHCIALHLLATWQVRLPSLLHVLTKQFTETRSLLTLSCTSIIDLFIFYLLLISLLTLSFLLFSSITRDPGSSPKFFVCFGPALFCFGTLFFIFFQPLIRQTCRLIRARVGL